MAEYVSSVWRERGEGGLEGRKGKNTSTFSEWEVSVSVMGVRVREFVVGLP